eukprot:6578859-Prymnesium_polylepis.1
MQALKMASEAEEVEEADVEEDAEVATFIKIPLKLTSEQAATSNYIFVSGPDDENNFLYKKMSDKPDKPDPAAKPVVAKVAAGSKAASKAAVKAVPAKPHAKTVPFASPAVGKKRKEPEPDPEPQPLSADDPAFQQAAI